MAHPKISEFPGTRANNIAPGHLKNPLLWSRPKRKGGTIPGWMHGKGGTIGEALPCPDLVKFSGPEIMDAFNVG